MRLLVADVPDGAGSPDLVTVARAGEPCRLGRGLSGSGRVDDEMAERAATLASEFARRATVLGAARILVGATAALRGAANGEQVAALVGERAGHPVRILSGEDEARLVYQAVVFGLRDPARRSACVVFDLGGGSTEVVSGLGETAGRWASLPIGAVSLTERFIRSNPVQINEINGLTAAVESQLMHHCAYMPEVAPMFAGVGGTVTVLASLDRGLSAYDPNAIQGWFIRSDRLEDLVGRLVASGLEERGGWPVMGKGRADIVVAGALVVRQLARRFNCSGLLCSTHGLRYGLARLAASEATAPGGGQQLPG